MPMPASLDSGRAPEPSDTAQRKGGAWGIMAADWGSALEPVWQTFAEQVSRLSMQVQELADLVAALKSRESKTGVPHGKYDR